MPPSGKRAAAPAGEAKPTDSRLNKAPEDIIRKAHELKARGLSYRKIADALNESGILTISGRGKWQSGSVARLFQPQEG
jgi:hypothetical protein